MPRAAQEASTGETGVNGGNVNEDNEGNGATGAAIVTGATREKGAKGTQNPSALKTQLAEHSMQIWLSQSHVLHPRSEGPTSLSKTQTDP